MKTLLTRLQVLSLHRTHISNYNITPQWLIGFIEAEGSFIGKEGLQPFFHLSQHAADLNLMKAIANFIGHGNVRIQKRSDGRLEAILAIYDKKVIRNKIIPPLLRNAFKSLKKINQFNTWVNYHFKDLAYSPINNPNTPLINNQWIVGFTDGDGSFYPMIHKAKDYKNGYQVQATFDLAQHEMEQNLLSSIGNQLCNNQFKWAKSKNTQHLRVLKLDTHISYIEPFFRNNQLQSRKIYDFRARNELLNLMKDKKHLTIEGLTIIRELQNLQNQYRYYIEHKNNTPDKMKI